MTEFLLRYPLCIPTLLGTLFGLLFPISTVLFMLINESQIMNWDNLLSLHNIHYDLFILWTAPLVLASFGGLIGSVTLKLKREIYKMQSRTTQLNTILDTATSGIITIDTKGTIFSFSHTAQETFGCRASEIIGKNFNQLMPFDLVKQHDRFLQHYLTRVTSSVPGKPSELTGKRKIGVTFPMPLCVKSLKNIGVNCISNPIPNLSQLLIRITTDRHICWGA